MIDYSDTNPCRLIADKMATKLAFQRFGIGLDYIPKLSDIFTSSDSLGDSILNDDYEISHNEFKKLSMNSLRIANINYFMESQAFSETIKEEKEDDEEFSQVVLNPYLQAIATLI